MIAISLHRFAIGMRPGYEGLLLVPITLITRTMRTITRTQIDL